LPIFRQPTPHRLSSMIPSFHKKSFIHGNLPCTVHSFSGWHTIRLRFQVSGKELNHPQGEFERGKTHGPRDNQDAHPPKRRGEVMEILSSLAERSRFEAGCIGTRVYQDVQVEPAILIEQLWKSGEDLAD